MDTSKSMPGFRFSSCKRNKFMNTNTRAKRILFYGDSLAFGKKPSVPERLDGRFTRVIQNTLGSDFEIIEEGLRARTLSGENTFFPERNGLDQFGPIFGSHLPIDLLVLMLGTNDCNKTGDKTKQEYHKALNMYLEKMNVWCKQFFIETVSLVLIIAPPHINGAELVHDKLMFSIFGEDAERKSKLLPEIYEKFCKEYNLAYFNADAICTTAKGEGIHLDPENNKILGEALALKIRNIFKEHDQSDSF